MKRLFLIVLVCVYTTATFGIGVRSFYCCNKLASTTFSFANLAEKKCGMKKEKDDCCKTKFRYVKVKDSHMASGSVTGPAKLFAELYVAIPSFRLIAVAPQQQTPVYQSNAPPLHNGLPLYIFDCVFRI